MIIDRRRKLSFQFQENQVIWQLTKVKNRYKLTLQHCGKLFFQFQEIQLIWQLANWKMHSDLKSYGTILTIFTPF